MINYVEFFSFNSKNVNKKFKLLIDTGASTSLVKANKLKPETYFNSKEKLVLHGLCPNNPVETVETTNIKYKT